MTPVKIILKNLQILKLIQYKLYLNLNFHCFVWLACMCFLIWSYEILFSHSFCRCLFLFIYLGWKIRIPRPTSRVVGWRNRRLASLLPSFQRWMEIWRLSFKMWSQRTNSNINSSWIQHIWWILWHSMGRFENYIYLYIYIYITY